MPQDVAPPRARPRLISIDVVRGLTIAVMLIVNDPGDAQHVFPTLSHSVWHGCTLADFVFPSFLLLVGITTQLTTKTSVGRDDAHTSWRIVWRRAAWLVGIGLLLNAYPFFEKSAVAGPTWLPLALQHVLARLESLRLLGVLQRIGLVYLAVAWPARRMTTRGIMLMIAAILVGYWLLLMFVPVPGAVAVGSIDVPSETWPVWVDQRLLDWERFGLGWHLWDRALPFDPEGVLSTIPAIATGLFGVLAARMLTAPLPRSVAIWRLLIAGAVMCASGAAWHVIFPINKALWSSSYVLLTAGVTFLLIGCMVWMIDVQQWKRVAHPLVVLGSNSIAVYVFAELIANVLRSSIKWKFDGRRVGTGEAVVRVLELIGVQSRVGSLVWALLFTVLCYGFAHALYRRRMFLKL